MYYVFRHQKLLESFNMYLSINILKSSLYSLLLILYVCSRCHAVEPDIADKPVIHQSCSVALPDGEKIDFIFVRVNDNQNLFSSTTFTMGRGLNHGYSYKVTHATVGGSIYCKDEINVGNAYWAIPIGKSEVTRGQYAAVMGKERPQNPNAPQTEVTKTEILAFITRLNNILFTPDATGKTPSQHLVQQYAKEISVDPNRPKKVSYLHGNLYARLPSEAEWEFAARGGLNVKQDVFNKLYPYKNQIEFTKNEVVAVASQGKPNDVMSRGQGNPCGLYDMLGNVCELVENSYCPEYHFGRTGGLLLRGAYWANVIPNPDIAEIEKSEICASSYYRQEIPTVVKGGGEYKASHMGFRIVLGSDFVQLALSKQINADMELLNTRDMVRRHPDASPAESANVSINRVNSSMNENISLLLVSLNEKINQSENPKGGGALVPNGESIDNSDAEDIKKLNQQLLERDSQIREMLVQMQEIEQKIQTTNDIVKKSQETLAMAGLELLTSSSVFAAQDIYQIYHKTNILPKNFELTAEEKQAISESNKVKEENVNRDWTKVVQGCEALALADSYIVEQQLNKREIAIKNNGDPYEIAYFEVSKSVYKQYKKSGMMSQDERERWKADLLKQCLLVNKKQEAKKSNRN